MEHVLLKARAKINIALDVLGKRADGYHDLRMIMQSVALHDLVFMKKTPQDGIVLHTNHSWLPVNEKNLVYRAVARLKERYDIRSGVYVDLQKAIPVSAGLAGGSTDCAAALIGMRMLFKLPISTEELMDIGAGLGADVPYCIMRGTALAEGLGERLKRLPPHPMVYVLLTRPPFYVSTAQVFQRFQMDRAESRPDVDGIVQALEAGDVKAVADRFCNVLETVTIPDYPVIAQVKDTMREAGCLGTLMSGSGPTVFAYFDRRDQALSARRLLRQQIPQVKETYLTTIFNPGP